MNLIESAGIDVPGVVVFGGVFEELELISATARCNQIRARALVEDAGNTSVCVVNSDVDLFIFEPERMVVGP